MTNTELHKNLIQEAIQSGISNTSKFYDFKKSFCSRNRIPQPTNADLRDLYNKMIASKKIRKNSYLERAMMSRGVRSESGVAVIAVLTKPSSCPGECIYCPTEKGMPKSYLSNEPAVMRAILNKFNPYRQVQNRIKSLELNGHPTDKIELIVMGGTFSYFPKSYQNKFITECFRACNDYTNRKSQIANRKTSLGLEQKRNEKSKHRIVGLTLETRPDYIDEKEILNFRNLGSTRVEIGVQNIYNEILEKNKRGHMIEETIRATKLLKDAGFKINYHLMPGLLGSSLERDFQMFTDLFSKPEFQPDMIKIYPTVVTKDSELYEIWKAGKYKALSDKDFEEFIIKVKNEIIPPYVRIARLIRDVPTPSIEAGPKVSNLRQLVAEKSSCPCIRCREVKSNYKIKDLPTAATALQAGKIILDRINYKASDGKEIFLQFVSPDKKKLFALLRLRIPSQVCHSGLSSKGGSASVGDPESRTKKEEILKQVQNNKLFEFFPTLKNSALIREVHTYGKLISIEKDDKSLPAVATALQAGPQHIGLGKKLIQEAERITREEFEINKIAIISGVGVRGYYRKLGYRLKDTYMVKKI